MLRKDRAYSFMRGVGVSSAKAGLDNTGKLGESNEMMFGALAGTALAALTVYAFSGNLAKKVERDKKNLDDTYSPIQRKWSEELEKMNKDIMIKSQIGSISMSIASLAVTMNYTHKLLNEAVGISIGGKIGKTLASFIMRKKIKEYKLLLIEYEDSLSVEQKHLRLELEESLDKLGLAWSIGVIGGLAIGAVIGDQYSKINK